MSELSFHLAFELPPTDICQDYARFQAEFVDNAPSGPDVDLSLEDFTDPTGAVVTDRNRWTQDVLEQTSYNIF
eukprot:1823031-Alexandrium_andersonii.AAC.1